MSDVIRHNATRAERLLCADLLDAIVEIEQPIPLSSALLLHGMAEDLRGEATVQSVWDQSILLLAELRAAKRAEGNHRLDHAVNYVIFLGRVNVEIIALSIRQEVDISIRHLTEKRWTDYEKHVVREELERARRYEAVLLRYEPWAEAHR